MKWCTAAPIVPLYRDKTRVFSRPVDLGAGVVLGPAPAWIKKESSTSQLAFGQREDVKSARLAFSVDYDADSLGHPDPEWKGKKPRGIQDSMAERISLANLALWLAQPTNLGFECIIDACDGSLRASSTYPQLRVRDDEEENTLSIAHVDSARRLHLALEGLTREGSLRVSIHALWKALTADWWEGRYLLLWIVLESLFGPDDAREMTYRIAQRIAIFLDRGGGKPLG